MAMTSMAFDSHGGARVATDFAGGINAGALAQILACGHYILLPLRYEKSRGRHDGSRQLRCFSDLRNELVLRSPRRRI
jgi:hypothetical protein